MTISPTFSSSAPTGWNQLPLEGKQKFYDIASKGDWNAHEAYDHLVPDHLKDNPEEVLTWMDGADITVDNVDYVIPDRDVSRIEAGGDYSPENTIMEDMSVNRSRGGVDMTASEFEAAEAANATDAELIEQAFESATESVAAPVETIAEVSTLAGDVGDAVIDGILPVIASVKAAQYVSDQFEDDTDKLGYGALAAGGAAAVMCSPLGAPIAAVYGVYALSKLGFNLFNRWVNA